MSSGLAGRRTTGMPESDGDSAAPPPQAGAARSMNLYDAARQTEAVAGANTPSTSNGARKKVPNVSSKKPAANAVAGAKTPSTSNTARKKAPNASSKKPAAAAKPMVLGKLEGANKEKEFSTEADLDLQEKKKSRGYSMKQTKSSYRAKAAPAVASASNYASAPPKQYPVTSAAQNEAFAKTRASPGANSKMYDIEEASGGTAGPSNAQGVRPGAVRVYGPGGARVVQVDHNYEDGPSVMDGSVTPVPPELATGQPQEEPIDARVMDAAEHERMMAERREQEKRNAPIANVKKERPWYLRPIFLGSIALLIIVIIVVAATIASAKKNAPAPVPTSSPTVSPAPTSLATITAVVQLDNNPGQTGWELTCDGQTLGKAEPGTYGLVDVRPNFRVEVELEATIGAECELNLTDLGGDGLNPGLYEVYYGTELGDQSTRLTSGSIHGSTAFIKFEIEVKSSTDETTPTVSDTSPNPPSCTLCADGSPVLFPEAIAPFGALTCEQVENLAKSTTNQTACKIIQDSAAGACGCRNSCTTMCPDGVSGPDPANFDSIVYIKDDRQVTCADFQEDIISSGSNSVDECLSANFIGEDVCGCQPTERFCRICEPAGEGLPTTNPPVEDMLKEIVPGVSCRDVTGIAYTLKFDDPTGVFQRLCPACLAIGAYCGCDQPENGREFCRLCGGSKKLLPEPGRLVDSKVLGQVTTCFHVELAANVNDPDNQFPCSVYQEDAAYDCCF